MNTETIAQIFTVPVPAQLSLSNLRGRVTVLPEESVAGEGPATIAIAATKHLDTGDADHTQVSMHQEPDGRVVVQTEHETIDHQGFHKPCRVEYLVHVPRQCSATLSCITCRLEISNIQGEFWLKSISGDMSLNDLEGPIEASNVSGKILGERLNGKAIFETTSGSVRLLRSIFPSLKATSVSGDLYIETSPGPGPYRFKSISGDITFILPEGSGYRAELRSISGRLLAFGTQADSSSPLGEERMLETDGSGPLILAETVSGNLNLPGKSRWQD
jgi:hypothetical protein